MLLESPGIIFIKFPGPWKSWKMNLVLESPVNLSIRSWKVLEFARQWCAQRMQLCRHSCQNMRVRRPLFHIVHLGKKWKVFKQFLYYFFTTCDSDEHILQFERCYRTMYMLSTGNCCFSLYLNIAVLRQVLENAFGVLEKFWNFL